MNFKLQHLLVISSLSLLLSSCGQTITRNPYYDGGLEGNADQDDVVIEDDNNLEILFDKIIKQDKFSYRVDVYLNNSRESFTQYFTPHAWYNDASGNLNDFGYGETLANQEMFKFYLSEDEQNVYPSIYEYSGYYELSRVTNLYGSLTIAHPKLLSDCLDTLSYVNTGVNSYLLTDTDTLAVFQYMTTYGSSIANYIVSLTIDIVDLESLIFETTIDLGVYGSILGRYEALTETKIDFVNEAIINDGLCGIDSEPIIEKVSTLLNANNFTLDGIKTIDSTSDTLTSYPYRIYCTNEYFYIDYLGAYSETYMDYGYFFVPSNTTVKIYAYDETGNFSNDYKESTLSYDACYRFSCDFNGVMAIDLLIGPVENESIKYLNVSTLPEVGEENILYILQEEDGKNVYEWRVNDETGEYDYFFYSSWYDSVGDFYLVNSATFYLGSTAFTSLAPLLMERDDHSDENELNFYSTHSDILSPLANGLFGWGFQGSNTWIDYIIDSFLDVTLDSEDNISSFDLGLAVGAYENGVYDIRNIFYTFSNFGSTSQQMAENFYQSLVEDK